MPAQGATALGRIELVAAKRVPAEDLIRAALVKAAVGGGQWVAVEELSARVGPLVGKMCPAGHGRSYFSPGSVSALEINRLRLVPYTDVDRLTFVYGVFD